MQTGDMSNEQVNLLENNSLNTNEKQTHLLFADLTILLVVPKTPLPTLCR